MLYSGLPVDVAVSLFHTELFQSLPVLHIPITTPAAAAMKLAHFHFFNSWSQFTGITIDVDE